MESCLQAIKTETNEEIRTGLKDTFSLFSQFSYLFNLIQSNYPDVMLLNNIDGMIKQSIKEFDNLYQILLNKFNLKIQNLSLPVDISQTLNQITNQPENNQNSNNNSKNQCLIRRPYRSYSRKQKNQVIELYLDGMSFYRISKRMGIPYRNVQRWCMQYCSKEQKNQWVNFKMEKQLWLWLESHPNRHKLLVSDIQSKSLQLAQNLNFKASRGWARNFLQRCDQANEQIHSMNLFNSLRNV